jgi:hypothetical protein
VNFLGILYSSTSFTNLSITSLSPASSVPSDQTIHMLPQIFPTSRLKTSGMEARHTAVQRPLKIFFTFVFASWIMWSCRWLAGSKWGRSCHLSWYTRSIFVFSWTQCVVHIIYRVLLQKRRWSHAASKDISLMVTRSKINARSTFHRCLSSRSKQKHIYMMSSLPLYLNKGVLFFEPEIDLFSAAATRLGKPSNDLA